MKNKITVSIAGQEYTMVAEEGEDYVKRCAALVDSQVRDVMNGARLGRSDAAVLAAMNIADQFFKEQEASENLRRHPWVRPSVLRFVSSGNRVASGLAWA